MNGSRKQYQMLIFKCHLLKILIFYIHFVTLSCQSESEWFFLLFVIFHFFLMYFEDSARFPKVCRRQDSSSIGPIKNIATVRFLKSQSTYSNPSPKSSALYSFFFSLKSRIPLILQTPIFHRVTFPWAISRFSTKHVKLLLALSL